MATRKLHHVLAESHLQLARMGKVALLLLLAVNAVMLVYFIFVGYRVDFHSDSAVKSLLAGEMIETGRYFPRDWNYVNGDLWTVFGQIFIAPFLPWLKNGYGLHAFAGFCGAALVLFSIWLVASLAIRSVWLRLVIVAALTSGISWQVSENLYGQVSYGNVLSLACFTLFLAWKFFRAAARRKRITYGALLLVLTTLTFWGNPQRAAAYDLLPLLAGFSVLALEVPLLVPKGEAGEWRLSSASRAWVAVVSVLVLGAGVGALLHHLTLQSVNNIAGAGAARWLSYRDAIQNVPNAVQGVIGIFGGTLPSNGVTFSATGLMEAFRFICSLAMLGAIPLASWHFANRYRGFRRLLGVYVLVSFGMFIFLHITTTIPDMKDPLTSARYLLPMLILGLIPLAAMTLDAGAGPIWRITCGLLLLFLMISPLSAQNPFSRIWRGSVDDSRAALIDALRANGLRYGYATYWNANAYTVLSDGEVRIRAVDLNSGLPLPFRHNSSNRWYEPSAWQGPSFLLLSDEELRGIEPAALRSAAGDPQSTFKLSHFTVLVYPQNLAKVLPGWKKEKFSGSIRMPVAASTKHSIGQLQASVGGQRITTRPGESGYLQFGPYLELPPGRYLASYRIQSSGHGTVGHVDVAMNQGQLILGAADIIGDSGGKTQTIKLVVRIPDHARDVEFRVFSNGQGAIELVETSLGLQ